MVNKLLTNGCSMTWGGGFLQSFLLEKANELNVLLCECVNKGKLFKDNSIITRGEKQEGIYHGEFCSENCTYEIVRKLITYPYKLSKLLDADELIDLSKPGQSCQYVVRTTTDFFIEKINNKEDLSDYIVLLQMPNGLRFEWWNEGIQQDSGVSADWQGKVIAFSEEKNIVNYFGNDMYKFYNVTNSIIQLASFLKENNIRYYFVATTTVPKGEDEPLAIPPNNNYWVSDKCSKTVRGCKLRWSDTYKKSEKVFGANTANLIDNNGYSVSNTHSDCLAFGGFPAVEKLEGQ